MKTLIAALLLSVCAYATTISQKLILGSGKPWNGTITLSLYTAGEAAGQYVVAAQFPVPVVLGNLHVVLAPGNYQVSYAPSLLNTLAYWIVPASGTYTVSQVETVDLPAPLVLVPLTQLAEGGATNYQMLVWNGSVWAPTSQVRNEALWTEYTGATPVASSGSLSISGGVATYVSGTPLTTLPTGYSAVSMLSEVVMIGGTGYYITTIGTSPDSWSFTPVPADGTVSYTIGNSWTLANTPTTGTSCWYNGIRQNPGGIGYILTGNVISSVYWNPTDLTANPTCDYQY